MQGQGGGVLFSAADLVAHLECAHRTTLALQDLEAPLARAEDNESLELIQTKGFPHEAAFLSSLREKNLQAAELPSGGTPQALARQTARAMREGHEVIFYAGKLGVDLGRQFLGVTAGLGTEGRIFLVNSDRKSVDRVLAHH